MRKFILAAAAVASLAVPAVASADVDRHQEQTGKITVTLPEYNLVHTFTDVTVNPCDDGAFTGVSGSRDVGEITEVVNGTIKGGVVEFSATYDSVQENGYSWHTTTPGHAIDSNGLNFDIDIDTSGLGSTNWKNHGQFVKANPDKNDAAHSCIGMPVNSSK